MAKQHRKKGPVRGRGKQATSRHRAIAALNRERHRVTAQEAAREDPEFAVSLGRCPDCGELIDWFTPEELEQEDPTALGALMMKFGADLVLHADTWLCPNCGSSGIVTDTEPPGGHDLATYEHDPHLLSQDDLAAYDPDTYGAASSPALSGADTYDLDPYDTGRYDTGPLPDHGLTEEELADLETCEACGDQVDWMDPARVATIDKVVYMQAKKQHGAAALLAGDAEVCRGCGRITFYPDFDAGT